MLALKSTLKSGLIKLVRSRSDTLSLVIQRTLLTESYYCYDQWDNYLKHDVLKKVGDVNNLAYEIDSKLNSKQLVTPLDMDLLATKIVFLEQFNQLEFIENIFAKYRTTQSALYVRDSMHYGFVRSYLDISQPQRLLQMLKLKYKYGLFADAFTLNMIMDCYMRNKDWLLATLTAHEVMLQEMNNGEDELTIAYALFSCIKYIWSCKEKKSNRFDDDDYQNMFISGEQDEKKEKKRLLVHFVRNEFSDDHFDLKSFKKLTGKTIYFTSSCAHSADSTLRSNLQVYGLLLFGKYDKAIELLDRSLMKIKAPVYDFVIDELNKSVELVGKDVNLAKSNQNFMDKWKTMKDECSKTTDAASKTLVGQIESYVNSTEKKHMSIDTQRQQKMIEKWSSQLGADYAEQQRNWRIETSRKQMLEELDELERREEMLTYFDNESKITNAYYMNGFPDERPNDIPIEPEQSEFNVKYERHFKPWPKHMNRPPSSLKPSEEEEYAIESLRRIYLNNEKAQTSIQSKIRTSGANY